MPCDVADRDAYIWCLDDSDVKRRAMWITGPARQTHEMRAKTAKDIFRRGTLVSVLHPGALRFAARISVAIPALALPTHRVHALPAIAVGSFPFDRLWIAPS